MENKKENNNNNQEKLQKKVKDEKTSNDKESLFTEFINIIKKRWLISGTNTLLLIAIIIAIVILINKAVQSLEITPIDCTSNKEYTLTDESKKRISDIQDEINVYLVGFSESDTPVTLAKQYNKSNENIKVEIIDINERTDIGTKYNLQSGNQAIVVENGVRAKTILASELTTYDSNYNTIDVTEEKVTSAILNVAVNEIPKIYFLSGYSDYKLEYNGGMYYLSEYLKDEVLEYEELNILTAQTIPEDCKTLVIPTPTKDFDELTTTEIIKYINKGGNILWLNSSYAEKLELPNVNKILALYAIDPFDAGYIYETDANRVALGYAGCILEDLGNTEIDQNLANVLLLNATKINVNADKISELGITEQKMITSSDKSYYRKDVSDTSIATDSDEQGVFTIAGIYTKTIENADDENKDPNSDSENNNAENSEENSDSENNNTESSEENSDDENNSAENSQNGDSEKVISQMVIIGDNNFISDIQISNQVSPMLFLTNNKDVMLNSIAYLTKQDSGITIRKDYNNITSFTATDGQKAVIIRVIFMVPIGIVLFGVVVWQVRRRKK